MRTMRRIVFVVAIVVLAALLSSGCGSKPVDQLMRSRFPARKDGSGVTSATLKDNKLTVALNFFPVSANSVKEAEGEIGILVGSAIKQAFEASKELESVWLSVMLPYNDDYGRTTWKAHCSFRVSRSLYDKINWDNFDKSTLLNLVEDLVRY